MFGFLNEPWEESVLEFHRFPHDPGAEDGRVFGTSSFSVRKDHYKEWPAEIIERACQEAGPMMMKLDYKVLT